MTHSELNTAIISIGIVMLLAVIPASGINIYRSAFSRYTVEGTVDGEVGSKLRVGTQDGGTTKYSVPVVTSSGKKIINCSSTQCASLSPQDQAVFSCFEEWNPFMPNEEECRFEALR